MDLGLVGCAGVSLAASLSARFAAGRGVIELVVVRLAGWKLTLGRNASNRIEALQDSQSVADNVVECEMGDLTRRETVGARHFGMGRRTCVGA